MSRKLLSDKADDEAFLSSLKEIDPKAMKEGLLMTADANISLPESTEGNEERFRRIKTIIAIASDNNSNALSLADELIGFLNQYPLHRKDLVDKMKAQYKPILDEKSEKLSKQYGQEIHLSYESDKEFMEAASKNLERLENQYQQTVRNAKAQLKDMIG